ncbi:MAG: MFS transporter [Pseudomonadota bacterium]
MDDASQPPVASARGDEFSFRYRALVLGLLIVVYTFNFIDRQIVGVLAVPIKAELALTDTQLSLMGGLAFALFYTFLGIPIAWLADRRSRTWIMTWALAIWSAMTALCGFAQNFVQLFAARLGVGVGEAGGVAPAYALIADYFPSDQRARALGVYSFGIPIGSALGIVLGGVLSELMGWRTAFFTVGLMGVAVAPIFRLIVREPTRGWYEGGGKTAAPAPVREVARTLARKRSFWALSLGAASSSMVGYGLIFWLPSFFVRSFPAELPGFFAWAPAALFPQDPSPLVYASYFFGLILLIGGITGIWVGGLLADRLGREEKRAYGLIPAAALAATLPFFLIGVLASNLILVFIAFLALQALAVIWLGPVLSAFQHLAPPNMRATASALFLFISNLIGLGVGNLVIGALSDALNARFGDESLRYAILSCTIFYVVAAALFYGASRTLDRDWEKA